MFNKSTLIALFIIAISGCKSVHTPSVHSVEGKKMLKGMKIAVLVTDGFEEVEMTQPRKALEDAGAEVVLIAPKAGRVQGFNHDKAGDFFKVDLPLNEAQARNFDALLLPGGVKNPDRLRIIPQAVQFIKDIGQANKPIAAICHGPWPLINAELVKGHTLTSWPSLEIDLRNAGAHWVDEEVVLSNKLVTSRKPQDIPAFNAAMIKLFAESRK